MRVGRGPLFMVSLRVRKNDNGCGRYRAHTVELQAMARAMRRVCEGVEVGGPGSRFETLSRDVLEMG